jgi:hypothetical protein
MPRRSLRLHAAFAAVMLAIIVGLLSGCAAVAYDRIVARPTPTLIVSGPFDPDTQVTPGASPAPPDGRVDVADGFIADGDMLSPFATGYPALAQLDPALLAAVQAAARDAEDDGVTIGISAGWRSAEYQQALLDEAIAHYGSVAEARRWVDTPEVSRHVRGEAVDILPTAADDWLRQHGSDYGLCQIYANEIWHFELATTPGGRCPRLLPDASHD